jgi:hypothetical protein
LPGLRCFCALDRQHVLHLAAVGQPVEGPPCVSVTVERFSEIGGHGNGAGPGVECDVDIHLIARGGAGAGADLAADRDHKASGYA